MTDAAVTSIGLHPADDARAFALGALLGLGLLLLGASLRPGARSSLFHAGLAIAVTSYVLRLSEGIGFIPGFLAAAPAAAAAIAVRSARARLLAIGSIASLVPVWAFQWRGNLIAQWGGRYVLLTGALLLVVASLALERGGWRRPAATALLALTAGVSIWGAAWHIERTSTVSRFVAAVESVPPDVVIIAGWAHLGREAGGSYGEHRWLSAPDPDRVDSAAAIARCAGASALDLVARPGTVPAPTLGEYDLRATRVLDYFGIDVSVHRYTGQASNTRSPGCDDR